MATVVLDEKTQTSEDLSPVLDCDPRPCQNQGRRMRSRLLFR
jgi:hypothetical protein